MSTTPLDIVILAAGEGTRMNSNIPKVLHKLAGKPLLEHVVNTAEALKADNIYVVYGNGGEQVKKQLKHLPVTWVEQKNQLGTAHAIKQVLPLFNPQHRILVLYGDVPLISQFTLEHLLERTPKDAVGWLTDIVKNPEGLGRIIRDEDSNPVKILEEKDTTEEQKHIKEINTGVCLIPVKYLLAWMPLIKNNNAQKEYYLTDMFALAIEHGVNITTVSPKSTLDILGVNDNVQLAYLERVFQKKKAEEYMRAGLTLIDPGRFDLRGSLTFDKDVVIDVNVVLEGDVNLGKNVLIEANVILKNVEIGDNTTIHANSIVVESIIENDCHIGPFARLRPGATLKSKAKIGNFVEVKKSTVGVGSKVNHLSYIGDSTLGADVNIGAGTITCNYDGVNKHPTTIGDNVFVGSCTALVAPINIGDDATIGAGSTITKDAPANALTLERAKQVTIEEWLPPKKRKKASST